MENETIKQKILRLKTENPTLGYRNIGKLANVEFGLVRYHLNSEYAKRQKERTKETLKETPLKKKVFSFTNESTTEALRLRKKKFNQIANNKTKTMGNKFKIKDLLERIGSNPICYLTGENIDLSAPSTYNLDHIIPISRGGDNSLENCGLASKQANQAKTNMIPEEFFDFCKKLLEYNGYKVIKD